METRYLSDATANRCIYGGTAVAVLAATACLAVVPYAIECTSAYNEARQHHYPSAEVNNRRNERNAAVVVEGGLGLIGTLAGVAVGWGRGFRRPEGSEELAATCVPRYGK